MPGDTTQYDDSPEVRILNASGGSTQLSITYYAGLITPSGTAPKAQILFHDVLEYRWVIDSFEYEDFDEHQDDFSLGLIEIVNSRYIDRMASRGPWRDHPQMRFGDVINEADVKHYRIVFDEYGHFDVIALGVSIEEVSIVGGG